MFFNNLMRYREPQASPFLPVCIKRHEEVFQHILRHSASGVSYLDNHEGSFGIARVGLPICGNRERSAFRHSLQRIEKQVEEQLGQLGLIGPYFLER